MLVIIKVKKRIKEHKKEILLVAGTAIVIGVTVYFFQNRRIARLMFEKSEALKRITALEKICEEKDAYVSTLGSELLRKGFSEGGRLMADKKSYLKSIKFAS